VAGALLRSAKKLSVRPMAREPLDTAALAC